jgi:hypothetical protein
MHASPELRLELYIDQITIPAQLAELLEEPGDVARRGICWRS